MSLTLSHPHPYSREGRDHTFSLRLQVSSGLTQTDRGPVGRGGRRRRGDRPGDDSNSGPKSFDGAYVK